MPRLAKLFDRLHLSSSSREGDGKAAEAGPSRARLGRSGRGRASTPAALPQNSAEASATGSKRHGAQVPPAPVDRNDRLVWSLVLDAFPQTPDVLCRVAAVSREARAEATDNARWATWSPMAAFVAPEQADPRARTWLWARRDRFAPEVPVGIRPRHLPYRPDHAMPEGCLHAAFVARMDGLLTDVLAAPRPKGRKASVPLPVQVHRALLEAYRAGPKDHVTDAVRDLAEGPAAGCFDLYRALVAMPRLGIDYPRADADVITEPSLYAAYFARHPVLLDCSPVVNDVRTYMLAIRSGHDKAYGLLGYELRERLDVAMYAVRFANHPRTHGRGLPEIFDEKKNYRALRAAVPGDSPVWNDPLDAWVMRQLTGPDKLNDVRMLVAL